MRDSQVAVVSPDVGGVKRADAFAESLERRIGHRGCAPLFAEAIRRMHTGGSLVELLQDRDTQFTTRQVAAAQPSAASR